MTFNVLSAFFLLFDEFFYVNLQPECSEMYSKTFELLQDLNSMAQKNVRGLE